MLALVSVLGVALAAGAASAARAQARSAQDESPAYRSAIAGAVEEFDLNHFSEAREQFVRAHALFPNARTLRGLGLCDFELRRYVSAVGYLRDALDSNVKRLEGGLRSATESILQRAESYVGTVRFELEPKDASVAIDGVNVEPNAAGNVLIEVGDHALVVRAAGHVTERRSLQVHGGQTQTFEVQLASVELGPEHVAAASAAPAEPLAPQPGPPADRPPVYKRWWLWTIVGVVVVGAAVGTAIALTRADDDPQYEPTAGANTPVGVSLQPLGARP